MPRYPLHAASGTGVYTDWHTKVIRFARYGCANRPFFHLVVMPPKVGARRPPIEQLGTYDPMVNQYNEKLMTVNFERLQFWLGQGNVGITRQVAQLLGLAGYLPIHPVTYLYSWRRRRNAEMAKAKAKEEAEAAEKVEEAN